MESVGMNNWEENWSSSESDDSGSSYSEDSNSSLRMEAVRVGGENLLLPQGLCDRPEIFKELLSQDTWNGFSEQQQEHLRNFLPNFPENDTEEKDKTVNMLFAQENIRFGNPLTEFQNQLQAAYFRPDVSKMRALLRKARHKDYKRAERWRYFDLVKSILASRQRLVDAVVNGEKPKVSAQVPKKPRNTHSHQIKSRYFQELSLIREEVGESSQSSEDENYPEGPLISFNKKPKRQAYLMEQLEDGFTPVLGTLSSGPSPWDSTRTQQTNPYATQEQSYTQMLIAHSKRRTKREEHPSLQTEGISLHEIAVRSKLLKRPANTLKTVVNKKTKPKVVRTLSVSSPGLDDLELDESSGSEEIASTLLGIKQDIEEEGEKVDIEGVDDLPSLPIVIRPPLNNTNQLTPKTTKASTLGTPRRIKTEPSEPLAKRLSTEFVEQPVQPKKIKVEPPEARQRKSRADSLDVHVRKVKTEPVDNVMKKIKVEPVEPPNIPNIKLETVETPQVQSVFSVTPVKTVTSRILTPATLSDLDGIDMMDLPVDFDESSALSLEDMKPRPELMQETQACFFSLIRDILTSTPDHRIEMRELESRVKAWANSPIGPINHWYTPHLESQLTSAVQFLAGDSSEILPEDYVPYMEYKPSMGAYQWIGAGRDSDHRLVTLCSLWLERGADRSCTKVMQEQRIQVEPPSVPPVDPAPPPPRGPAVQPTSHRDRQLFRIQEKQRFENPSKAFTYSLGGTDTTVGPVRGLQSGNPSKARGHSLLIDERPKCITILELVRDAVARLPNAQGTRADIVTLLKDSQYLLDNAQEGVLSSVVSGALDRLHYEHDPSVKYDPKRKIWVYLHKGRSPGEFERLHALGADLRIARPKPARKPPKPKKDALPKEEASATAAIVTADSSEPAVVTIRTTPLQEGGTPLVVQARPSVTGVSLQKAVSVPRKVVTDGVKSILGKGRVKVQQAVTSAEHQLIQRVQQQQQAQQQVVQQQVAAQSVISTVKCSSELQKAIATSSVVPTRTIIQEATISVPTSQANILKKATPQSVTISTEQVQKPGAKSIVKVITSSQPSTVNTVRTVQRPPQVTQQQVIQLKQQILADQKLVQKQVAGVKKTISGTGQPQQQQLIVMKQASSDQGGAPQQQMIVINQQQMVVDPQLTVKQQKQLQQLLTKQHLEQQGSVTIQQQQLQQLLLAKQQQMVVEQKAGKSAQHSGQQMIVVKQQTSGGDGIKQQPLQQMILLKQQGQQGTGETHQITQQQLQQMLLLKQQQQQQQQQQQNQQQGQQQQMIIVKQDQKAVQVITQPQAKGQQITIAQLQQLHQQQQQQRNAATTSLLTHPRVVTHVTTAAGTSLIKPQGHAPGQPVVAKVVSNAQGQVISMESLLAHHKQQTITQQAGVRMPVTRTIPSQQYTVVSMPQQRVVQTNVSQATSTSGVVVTGATMAMTTGDQNAPKFVTAGTNMRIPGLNLTQIAGKQVLLASKPQSIQGQNVILGNSGGQTVLVASQGNPGQQGTLTVLQQGSQQILIPSGALNLKALQGLKVIPLAKQSQQPGKQQVFARIINPAGARPAAVVANVVPQEPHQPPQTKE